MKEGTDLTEGNIFRNMLKYAMPLLITNLLNSMYHLIDGIWVGNLIGDDGVAIITNAWPITLVASSMISGVQILASVFVSQSYVNADKNKIKEVVTPIYLISIVVGVITSLILILSENFWLKLFNTPQEIILSTKIYLNIFLIGYMFNFIAMTIVETIRATGDSKTPLYILMTIEIVNIILDPILILCGLGIAGAAIATAIAMVLGLIFATIYVIRKNKDLCFDKKYMKLEKEFLKKSAILGIPMAVQELSTIFTIMLEVNVSNSLGIVGSTAYGVVSKLQSIIWIIGGTVKTLLTIVAGQFIGKGKIQELGQVLKNALKLIIIPTIIIAIFLLFLSKPFCYIFTQNEEILYEAVNFLKSAGFCFTLVPLCQMLSGFILGIGNTKFTFIVSMISNVVEFILIITINNLFNIPMIAIGIGISGWYIVNTFVCGIYCYSKKWKNIILQI